jgi:hypothetical protein
VEILISLVKLGVVGTSLAFLYLSFQLLKGEQELKDNNGNPTAPRPILLTAIVSFRRAALTFFVVGVALEFFLSQGPAILAAVNQTLLKKDMLRVRFDTWEFSPEAKKISAGFEENRADTSAFIPAALKDSYSIYVGVRKKDATPAGKGQYGIMLGPYPLSNQHDLDRALTDDELSALGNDCVQFTAFGILKSDVDATDVAVPFKPSETAGKVSVFNSATACNT